MQGQIYYHQTSLTPSQKYLQETQKVIIWGQKNQCEKKIQQSPRIYEANIQEVTEKLTIPQ